MKTRGTPIAALITLLIFSLSCWDACDANPNPEPQLNDWRMNPGPHLRQYNSDQNYRKTSSSFLKKIGPSNPRSVNYVDTISRCKDNQFYCSWSKQCVSLKKRCDDQWDCTRGEDEKNCPSRKRAAPVVASQAAPVAMAMRSHIASTVTPPADLMIERAKEVKQKPVAAALVAGKPTAEVVTPAADLTIKKVNEVKQGPVIAAATAAATIAAADVVGKPVHSEMRCQCTCTPSIF